MDETYIPLEEVISKLVAILKEEGHILFAQVPGRLKPLDYKQYSGKQGLKTWLLSLPDFEASEDGLSLELAVPADQNSTEKTGCGSLSINCNTGSSSSLLSFSPPFDPKTFKGVIYGKPCTQHQAVPF